MLGSARVAAGDPRHDAAGRLGGLLAAQGWTVVTGGYGGVMAAVSRGAAAAGGHTVGLPRPSPGSARHTTYVSNFQDDTVSYFRTP